MASATKACELTEWKRPRYLSTLAAAYSETGDFSNAVKCQEMAIAFMAVKDPERAQYAHLLERYRIKKPYRSLTILEELGLKDLRALDHARRRYLRMTHGGFAPDQSSRLSWKGVRICPDSRRAVSSSCWWGSPPGFRLELCSPSTARR